MHLAPGNQVKGRHGPDDTGERRAHLLVLGAETCGGRGGASLQARQQEVVPAPREHGRRVVAGEFGERRRAAHVPPGVRVQETRVGVTRPAACSQSRAPKSTGISWATSSGGFWSPCAMSSATSSSVPPAMIVCSAAGSRSRACCSSSGRLATPSTTARASSTARCPASASAAWRWRANSRLASSAWRLLVGAMP